MVSDLATRARRNARNLAWWRACAHAARRFFPHPTPTDTRPTRFSPSPQPPPSLRSGCCDASLTCGYSFDVAVHELICGACGGLVAGLTIEEAPWWDPVILDRGPLRKRS